VKTPARNAPTIRIATGIKWVFFILNF